MDLKGSLVNTHLRIYPSEYFTTFLKSLPNEENIPPNILKIIGKNNKGNLNEDSTQPKKIYFTDEDLKNIENIGSYVKANTVSEPVKEPVACNKDEESEIEKEKSGDTPEKQVKDSKEKGDKNKPKKKKSDNVKLDKDAIEKQDSENSTEENSSKDRGPFLSTSDMDWLYFHLQKRRSKGDDVPYVHNLIEGASIEMPENKVLVRNPELEARCVKLRAQEEARAYRRMTKGVDNVRMNFPEDSISYQMKQLNRHLIAIGQFILSIFAGFMFGFKGIEWTIGDLDFGFRLLLGVMCALIIALAEIYFLAKKLNEELSVPETVQLGGPVKFVDEPKYRHLPSQPVKQNTGKEHQD